MRKESPLHQQINSSEAYTYLAQYYDRLMEVDYSQWVAYLKRTWQRFGFKPRKVLDIGCGTGNITVPLAQMGLEVTAVDYSPAMIQVARAKAEQAQVSVNFVVQKMQQLQLAEQFDMVVCCCDVVNYLTTETDLQQFISRVYQHTKPGGLFLFDLNSEFKLKEIYGNQSYADLFDDCAYFWDNSFDEVNEICTMNLTFFIEVEPGVFRRVSEFHREKLWRPDKIFTCLRENNWEIIGYYEFLTWREPQGDAERWQFAVKKGMRR